MDFELGSVIGYRHWVFGYKESLPGLFSVVDYEFWPYGVIKAECRVKHPPIGKHEAPNIGCQCGIYSLRTPEHFLGSLIPSLFGSVEAFGKIIVHEEGYRSEYCRVLTIGPTVTCSTCHSEKINLLTDAYRIDFVSSWKTDDHSYAYISVCDKCLRKDSSPYKPKLLKDTHTGEILGTYIQFQDKVAPMIRSLIEIYTRQD